MLLYNSGQEMVDVWGTDHFSYFNIPPEIINMK